MAHREETPIFTLFAHDLTPERTIELVQVETTGRMLGRGPIRERLSWEIYLDGELHYVRRTLQEAEDYILGMLHNLRSWEVPYEGEG